MKRILAISAVAFALAGCTAREQQLLAAVTVGAVAGAVITNEVSRPRPVYVEDRYGYVPQPTPRPYYVQPYQRPQDHSYYRPQGPSCAIVWGNTRHGYTQRRICR
jgi:hypothetical protein